MTSPLSNNNKLNRVCPKFPERSLDQRCVPRRDW